MFWVCHYDGGFCDDDDDGFCDDGGYVGDNDDDFCGGDHYL